MSDIILFAVDINEESISNNILLLHLLSWGLIRIRIQNKGPFKKCVNQNSEIFYPLHVTLSHHLFPLNPFPPSTQKSDKLWAKNEPTHDANCRSYICLNVHIFYKKI